MRDSGLVLTSTKDFAQVEVSCLETCQGCAAKALCIGQGNQKGILSVKNPLQALPGDQVWIDIPEKTYDRSLILLFGTLLFCSLFGMVAGYVSAGLLSVPAQTASILGLFLGLFASGAWLSRHFRKKTNQRLFPTITKITQKGGYHE